MYDKRLAEIDGAEKVYTPTHRLGKETARRVLKCLLDAEGWAEAERRHLL